MSSTREIKASGTAEVAGADSEQAAIAIPITVVATLTSNATRPPYTSWEKMSTPTWSVPSQCPGENAALRLDDVPLVGEGSL